MRILLICILCATIAAAQYIPPGGGGGAPTGAAGGVLSGTYPNPAAGSTMVLNNQANTYTGGGLQDFGTDPLKFSGILTGGQTDAPASSLTAALAGAGAGNVDNGAHNYVVTYVTSTGETSGDVTNTCLGMVTVADKTANGKVQLSTIPTGPAGVTARKIYRSGANVSQTNFDFACSFGLLLTTINDNTTTTYLDNTADADLTDPYVDVNTTGFSLANGTTALFGMTAFNYWNSVDATITGPSVYFLGNLTLVETGFGTILNIQAGDTGGGVIVESIKKVDSNAPSIEFEGFILGTGPLVRPLYHFNVLNVTNYQTFTLGDPILSVDIDGASFGGQPSMFAIYTGATAGHFPGGYNTDGGFVGINTVAAPIDAYLEIGGTTFPARSMLKLRATASQSGPLLRATASDGSTDLFGVSSAGVISSASGSDTNAACWKTASGGVRVLGYCSSVVGAGGTCTCN